MNSAALPTGGKIVQTWIVTCGQCQGQLKYGGGAPAKHFALLGYKNLAGLGWVCPACLPTVIK